MSWLAAVGIFLANDVAVATTARYAPLTELTQEAELIALGTVTEVRSFWQGGRILTRASLTIEEAWAGEPGRRATVEVDSLGGVVDGIGQRVAGAVQLRPGDRVVLFLQRRAAAFEVVGMAQGAFWLEPGDDTDVAISRRSFGMQLVDRNLAEHWPTRLGELRRRVRELRRVP